MKRNQNTYRMLHKRVEIVNENRIHIYLSISILCSADIRCFVWIYVYQSQLS